MIVPCVLAHGLKSHIGAVLCFFFSLTANPLFKLSAINNNLALLERLQEVKLIIKNGAKTHGTII